MSQLTGKTVLSKSLFTERFELKPMGWMETARQVQIVEQDDELRALLTHRRKPQSILKTFVKTKGSKPPKRILHKVISRANGEAIGYHIMKKISYNSATMAVIIHDRNWWGTGAVIEIRKAIITAYKEATRVNQFCAEVHSRNFASLLNYKKLGFENVGVRYSCTLDEIRDEPADYFSFSLRGEALENSIAAWKSDDA